MRVLTRRAYRRGVSLSFHGTPRRVDPACQSRHRFYEYKHLGSFSPPISGIQHVEVIYGRETHFSILPDIVLVTHVTLTRLIVESVAKLREILEYIRQR